MAAETTHPYIMLTRAERLRAARTINRGDILYVSLLDDCRARAAIRSSRGDTVHITEIDMCTGKARCTCKAFMYRGRCRHVAALALYLHARLGRNLPPHPHGPAGSE